MLKLALAFALCASSALPSIRYTFYETWIDELGGERVPTLQYMGFTYNSPTFFAGGVLTPEQVGNCGGFPHEPTSRCGGGTLYQTEFGVSASQLLEGHYGNSPEDWGPPEGNGFGAAFFPGVQLDEVGDWSVSMAGPYTPSTLMGRLTIINDASPEPGAAGLAVCGIGFLALVSLLKRRLHRYV
jgi:hypothetical protein